MAKEAPAMSTLRKEELVTQHISPATQLLEKRREMFEVQTALDAQRGEFQHIEENIRRREHQLKRRDLELQESLIKFNKFLQDNDAKRNRAEKRAQDEVKQRSLKEDEIASLQAQLELLKAEKTQMAQAVTRDMLYAKYLESVLEVADEFPETKDLLMRFATLSATNSDLQVRGHEAQREAEEMRQQLQRYIDEKTDEILGFNNQIAGLAKTLEEAQRNAFQLQSEMDRTLQDAADRTLQVGQIIMGCENLYNRIQDKSSIKREATSDTFVHLKTVGDYVSDLTQVVKSFPWHTRKNVTVQDKVQGLIAGVARPA